MPDLRPWLAFIRPGDWLILCLGAFFAASGFAGWMGGGVGERVLVRQGGQVVADLALHEARELTVSGPLGPTRIEIADGRVRVAADPGPRQYCVRQGWLTHPGEIAVCAPNQVSVQVEGRTRRYDTLGY